MRILNLKQGSQEWLDSRKESFNASETPALFECSPWLPRTPIELAHLKYGELIIPKTRAMEDGSKNEEWIREKIVKETGIIFEPLVGVWDEDERFRASFDGIDFEGEYVLEIKYSKHTYEKLKDGEIPQNYYLQMQHQLLVSEASKVLFAVSDPESKEIEIKEVERDQKTIDEIVKRWIEFEAEFKGKKLPPLEKERDDVEWELAAEAYRVAKLHYDEAKKALDEAKQVLIELSEGVKSKGHGVVVIPKRSVRYNYAKAKEYIPPEVLEQIRQEMEYFDVRFAKEKK